MSHDIFIFGFADELVKLAQKPQEPGTRIPPELYPEKTWTPKPQKPASKPVIPKAEGYVPGTVVSGLPKRIMKGSPKGIVSAVGERMKWEQANKPKLPGWLSDSMKRPVKGHSMASPEAVARSKAEDIEAKSIVSKYTKEKPGSKKTRIAKKPVGLWGKEMAAIKRWKGPSPEKVRIRGIRSLLSEPGKAERSGDVTGKNLNIPSFLLRPRTVTAKTLTVKKPITKDNSGWAAGIGQKPMRKSRFFSDANVSPGGTVIPIPGHRAVAKKRTI